MNNNYLALLILFCTSAFSELRTPLDKGQYSTLQTFFSQQFSQRFDLYFEAFNGKEYLLEKKKIKFRLKNSRKKTIVQITQEIGTATRNCGPHKVSWKKRVKFESKNQNLIRILLFKGFEIFKHLHSKDIVPLNVALDFDLQIRSLDFEGKELLFKSLEKSGPYIFVPSHTNKKYRRKKSISLGKGKKMKFTLGKTLERTQKGLFLETYELEAEDSKMNKKNINLYLKPFCRYLKKIKPSSEEDFEGIREKTLNLKLYLDKMPTFIFKKNEK
ncbi:MAG: hypothetical protein VYD54_10400 [Bdellovibrionota bacterium]|nr:hypothetical protein [Bdellovibrionota bacterium]